MIFFGGFFSVWSKLFMLIFEYFCGFGLDFFLMSGMGLYIVSVFCVFGGRLSVVGVGGGRIYLLLVVGERFIEVLYVGGVYIVEKFVLKILWF